MYVICHRQPIVGKVIWPDSLALKCRCTTGSSTLYPTMLPGYSRRRGYAWTIWSAVSPNGSEVKISSSQTWDGWSKKRPTPFAEGKSDCHGTGAKARRRGPLQVLTRRPNLLLCLGKKRPTRSRVVGSPPPFPPPGPPPRLHRSRESFSTSPWTDTVTACCETVICQTTWNMQQNHAGPWAVWPTVRYSLRWPIKSKSTCIRLRPVRPTAWYHFLNYNVHMGGGAQPYLGFTRSGTARAGNEIQNARVVSYLPLYNQPTPAGSAW